VVTSPYSYPDLIGKRGEYPGQPVKIRVERVLPADHMGGGWVKKIDSTIALHAQPTEKLVAVSSLQAYIAYTRLRCGLCGREVAPWWVRIRGHRISAQSSTLRLWIPKKENSGID
jgi:hypothetical protein